MTAAEKADVEQFALEDENRRLEARVKELEAQIAMIHASSPNNEAPCPHCGDEIDSLYDRIGGDSETGVYEDQENDVPCPHCGKEVVIVCDYVWSEFKFRVEALP